MDPKIDEYNFRQASTRSHRLPQQTGDLDANFICLRKAAAHASGAGIMMPAQQPCNPVTAMACDPPPRPALSLHYTNNTPLLLNREAAPQHRSPPPHPYQYQQPVASCSSASVLTRAAPLAGAPAPLPPSSSELQPSSAASSLSDLSFLVAPTLSGPSPRSAPSCALAGLGLGALGVAGPRGARSVLDEELDCIWATLALTHEPASAAPLQQQHPPPQLPRISALTLGAPRHATPHDAQLPLPHERSNGSECSSCGAVAFSSQQKQQQRTAMLTLPSAFTFAPAGGAPVAAGAAGAGPGWPVARPTLASASLVPADANMAGGGSGFVAGTGSEQDASRASIIPQLLRQQQLQLQYIQSQHQELEALHLRRARSAHRGMAADPHPAAAAELLHTSATFGAPPLATSCSVAAAAAAAAGEAMVAALPSLSSWAAPGASSLSFPSGPQNHQHQQQQQPLSSASRASSLPLQPPPHPPPPLKLPRSESSYLQQDAVVRLVYYNARQQQQQQHLQPQHDKLLQRLIEGSRPQKRPAQPPCDLLAAPPPQLGEHSRSRTCHRQQPSPLGSQRGGAAAAATDAMLLVSDGSSPIGQLTTAPPPPLLATAAAAAAAMATATLCLARQKSRGLSGRCTGSDPGGGSGACGGVFRQKQCSHNTNNSCSGMPGSGRAAADGDDGEENDTSEDPDVTHGSAAAKATSRHGAVAAAVFGGSGGGDGREQGGNPVKGSSARNRTTHGLAPKSRYRDRRREKLLALGKQVREQNKLIEALRARLSHLEEEAASCGADAGGGGGPEPMIVAEAGGDDGVGGAAAVYPPAGAG